MGVRGTRRGRLPLVLGGEEEGEGEEGGGEGALQVVRPEQEGGGEGGEERPREQLEPEERQQLPLKVCRSYTRTTIHGANIV